MHVRRQRRTCDRLLGALGATFAGASLRLVERRVCLRWSFLFCSQDVSHSERLFTLLVRRRGGRVDGMRVDTRDPSHATLEVVGQHAWKVHVSSPFRMERLPQCC